MSRNPRLCSEHAVSFSGDRSDGIEDAFRAARSRVMARREMPGIAGETLRWVVRLHGGWSTGRLLLIVRARVQRTRPALQLCSGRRLRFENVNTAPGRLLSATCIRKHELSNASACRLISWSATDGPNTVLFNVTRSCDFLRKSFLQGLSSVQSLMLSVHLSGGLRLCRTPSTEPSSIFDTSRSSGISSLYTAAVMVETFTSFRDQSNVFLIANFS